MIGGETYLAPVSVKHAVMFMDGGTLSLMIVDARGKELQVCNDRSVVRFLDGPRKNQMKVGPQPIYIGGHHPRDRAAKPLELGGADEQALHRMLKDWFEEAQGQGGPTFPDDNTGSQARYATDFLRYLEWHVELRKSK